MPIPFMIVSLVDYIHKRVVQLGEHCNTAFSQGRVVSGNVKKSLDEAIAAGRQLQVRVFNGPHRSGEVESRSNPGTFHATCINTVDVAAIAGSCCGRFSNTGIPCSHQTRLATQLRLPPASLVRSELTVATGRVMYNSALPVKPISTVNIVGKDTDLKPPDEPKPKGRPCKKRKASMGEPAKGKSNRCGRCGQSGHNSRKCKAPLSSQQQLTD